jgi:hypothetical protein
MMSSPQPARVGDTGTSRPKNTDTSVPMVALASRFLYWRNMLERSGRSP